MQSLPLHPWSLCLFFTPYLLALRLAFSLVILALITNIIISSSIFAVIVFIVTSVTMIAI